MLNGTVPKEETKRIKKNRAKDNRLVVVKCVINDIKKKKKPFTGLPDAVTKI